MTLLQPFDQHRTMVTTPRRHGQLHRHGWSGPSRARQAATPKDQQDSAPRLGGRTEAEGGMVIKGWHGCPPARAAAATASCPRWHTSRTRNSPGTSRTWCSARSKEAERYPSPARVTGAHDARPIRGGHSGE